MCNYIKPVEARVNGGALGPDGNKYILTCIQKHSFVRRHVHVQHICLYCVTVQYRVSLEVQISCMVNFFDSINILHCA